MYYNYNYLLFNSGNAHCNKYKYRVNSKIQKKNSSTNYDNNIRNLFKINNFITFFKYIFNEKIFVIKINQNKMY